MAIAYGEVQEGVRAILEGVDYSSIQWPTPVNHPRIKAICDPLPGEFTINNLPMWSVIAGESDYELVTINDGYWEAFTVECTIYAFHLRSYRDASSIRDQILALARNALRTAGNFHSSFEAFKVGPKIMFGSAPADGLGGHIAMATLTIVVLGYDS